MDGAVRGLPLLSGAAPIVEEPNRHGCRKCGKEFGLFTRARTCNHCGFQYCTSCTDHQALLVRRDSSGESTGYDSVPVCAFCIPNLTLTASGRTQLRAQPVATLKAYLKAYNVPVPPNALEKDEYVEAALNARGPDGCLKPINEDYYRKHSVPNRTPEKKSRGLFQRMSDMAAAATGDSSSSSSSPPFNFSFNSNAPRPNAQTRPSNQARPTPPPTPQSRPQPQAPNGHSQQRPQARYTNPNPYAHPQQQSQYNIPSSSPYGYRPPGAAPPPPPPNGPPPARNSTRPMPGGGGAPSPNMANRPASEGLGAGGGADASGAPPRSTTPAAPQTPTMDDLLELSPDDVHALSVGTLKNILYDNHVLLSQILEKDDLVSKVLHLVDQERQDRAREAEIHAREEEAYLEQQRVMREEFARQQAARAEASASHASTQGGEEGVFGMEQGHGHNHDHEHGSDHEHLEVPTDGASVHSHHSETPAPAPAPAPASVSATHLPGTAASPSSKPPNPPPATVERSGLCVICQDEEANIVIVDCGHLAMCRNCSDLIMNTSRECPLCRTRIVTPQRLLRIFKS